MIASAALTVAGLMTVTLLSGHLLVAAGLINLSSIYAARSLLDEGRGAKPTAELLASALRWHELAPRYASRRARFEALAAGAELSTVPVPIQLYERLQLARKKGDVTEVKAIEGELSDLHPLRQLNAPATILTLSGWDLLGFDLSSGPCLRLRDELDIILYWERDVFAAMPGEAMVKDWKLIWAGNRVFQIGKVRNLVSNGGFEWTVDLRDRRPPGWPYEMMEPNRPNDLPLQVAERNGLPTVVLHLDNRYRKKSAWHSLEFPVEEDRLYLQAASVRTSGRSEFCIGQGWYHLQRKDFYKYLVCGQALEWTHYGGLVRPLPGAEVARFQLLNLGPGEAWFDDALFVPIELGPLSLVP
ncbi:hypothetical protein MYX75_00210 [Acidobacteria bacterium AH-259-A15]|nr:hypothetical protein [Acidobacteria bacterium AH-259-A15]